MRIHKEKVVEKVNELIEVKCDMCGASTKNVEPSLWTSRPMYGVTHSGSLNSYFYYGDELIEKEVDICGECAEHLIKQIQSGELKRTPGIPR